MTTAPSRARPAAALAVLCALAAAGCGKSDLATTASAPASAPQTATASKAAAPAHTTPPVSVPVPLPITPKRSAAFASAVQLTAADLPGAHESPRSKTPLAREREAAKCGGRSAPTVGGGRSPEFERGRGLDRETISSSVEVLHSARSVERDLEYAQTSGGLRCYERVLSRSLQAEADPNIKLLGVRVAPLEISIAGAGRAKGLRIVAGVGVPGAGAVVKLYVDALSLPYGPAEIDLFGTSFVQPVPERTEQELLALLHQRARAQRL
jgi:hypothetical protein